MLCSGIGYISRKFTLAAIWGVAGARGGRLCIPPADGRDRLANLRACLDLGVWDLGILELFFFVVVVVVLFFVLVSAVE